jgi:protein ImuB
MTVAESMAYCAGLETRAWDDAVIDRAVVAVTAALVTASPQVTPVAGSPGTWWVGATGLGTPVGAEQELVEALAGLAAPWHPAARVAVADSCVAARAATWADQAAGSCIVPPGGCAAYLAPAPLTFIPMDDEMRTALLALGVRTVGALAALAAADVERRWGALGLSAWGMARGDDRRRPTLARSDRRRAVTADLATPATTVEPVLFLVRAALERLVAQLVADGRTAATIALTLALDVAAADAARTPVPQTITREAQLARPVARVAPLLERCRSLLDRFGASAPVIGVTVAVTATAPAAGEQGGVFDATWRDPAAVEAAFARLRAELGPRSVVRPVAHDDHRPEARGRWEDETGSAALVPAPRPASVPVPVPALTLALGRGASLAGLPTGPAVPTVPSGPPAASRLLEVPEPVTMECDDDRPVAMQWRAARVVVEAAIGPERLTGRWWADEYARDYWRCRGNGVEWLVFRDGGAASDSGADDRGALLGGGGGGGGGGPRRRRGGICRAGSTELGPSSPAEPAAGPRASGEGVTTTYGSDAR